MKVPTLGIAGFVAALGVAGLLVAACSSSTTGAAVTDAGKPPTTVDNDAGTPVGATCAKDTDCPTGDQCTSTVYAAGNPVYPTAVCVAACTPPSDPSQGIAPCGADSIPGEGLCQPPSGSGSGVCLPLCEVTSAGTVTGCAANDVCQLLGAEPPDGVGWCQPGCTSTSQCPAGSVCDPLLAACVETPIATTLPIGASCSLTASPPPCNCVGTASEATGYCTAACVTGATVCPSPPDDGGAPPAPDGGGGEAGASSPVVPWVCSAGLNLITDADGGVLFTTQPPGLFGFCAPPCNTNDDCASFAGHCSQGDPAAPPGFTGTCVTGS